MKNYKFRKVEKKDIWDLLLWRNQKEIRRVSLNSKKILKKEHLIWFDKIIKDKGILFYLLIQGKKKAGYIKSEKNKKKFFISIMILKQFRRKSLFKLLISYIHKKIKKNYKVKQVYAYVKKNNSKSLKAFTKFGYTKNKFYNDFILLKYKFK